MRTALLLLWMLWGCGLLAQDLEHIAKEKPIRFSGGLSVGANFYQVQGIEPRSKPFLWSLNGSPTLTIYGVSLPFYFNIGAQNRTFSQPFNQFGVSPKYKWLTLHGGWRSLQYSNFTLGGLVVLGGGFEMRPGKFRLSMIGGRLNKAVAVDSNQKVFGLPPSYRRMLYAGKIGVGNEKNYIDLVVLKGKDDSTSYPGAPASLRPQENLVLGLHVRAFLFKHVQLGFEVAGSAYTRDQRLDSLDEPMLQRFSFFSPNFSSQLLFAGNAFVGYTSRYVNLKVNYRRVDQDYKSMGAYIFQTDMEAWTVEPSFQLFKGRIRVSGSLGLQRDNLLRNKLATTERTIGSLNMSVQASRSYGFDVQYGNYGIVQRAGLIAINDTTRMALANQSFTFINRFARQRPSYALHIIALTMYQNMSSLNPFQAAQMGNEVWIGNLNGSYSVTATGQQFSLGMNASNTRFSSGEALQIGPTAGVGRMFLKKKLNCSFTFGWMMNRFSGKDTGYSQNAGLTLQYRLSRMHSFYTNIRYTRNATDSPVALPFTEMWTNAGYQFHF